MGEVFVEEAKVKVYKVWVGSNMVKVTVDLLSDGTPFEVELEGPQRTIKLNVLETQALKALTKEGKIKWG